MPTRREALSTFTLAAPAALLLDRRALAAGPTPAAKPSAAPAFAGRHAPVPLRFDPKRLRGISERMIVSHHQNNYTGAIKNLNKVEADLAALGKDAPGYLMAGLKERELVYGNSAQLHEAYFGNLGGDGKAGGAVEKRAAEAYGAFARFEDHFRAAGAALGGGSGWVIAALHLPTGEVRIWSAGNHTQLPAASLPLLVLDMFEHAYAMDFGAAAAKYIEVFFQNVDWDEVNRRLAHADKAASALRA